MQDITTIVDIYLSMWNETDPARRAELIRRAWIENARYVDPKLEASGYAGLAQMVAGAQMHYPGHRVVRTSAVDVHHDQLRFAWKLSAPDGSTLVAGLDVGELAPDGRLRRITGFFGDLAS